MINKPKTKPYYIENKEPRSLVSDMFSTKVHLEEAQSLTGTHRIKESKGTGILEQIILRSNNLNYTFQVIIDDDEIYNKPLQFFLTHTAIIDNISAYLAGGIYYLIVQNLYFQQNYSIRVICTGTVIFSVIMIRQCIRNEEYIGV